MADQQGKTSTRTGRPGYPGLILSLLLLLLLTVLLAAATGSISIPMMDAWTTLLAQWKLPIEPTASPTHQSILTDIRFPRMAVAAAAGAALALAGTLLAGSFRNPLAEPVTTGTAAGALLGASIAIFLLPTLLPLTWLTTAAGTPTFPAHLLRILLASLFALGATLLVWLTARTAGAILTGPLLLAGLSVNALIGATAALFLFIGPPGAVTTATLIIGWTFGGLLTESGPGFVHPVIAATAAALLITIPLVRPLDILLAGEEQAASSGVSVTQVRMFSLVAACIATGAAVALAGVIAFIGLIAPTLLRRFTGANHKRLIPAAMILGATLLVAADAIGRRAAAPLATEIPAGVITALIGAGVLLVVLIRTLKEASQ